MVSDFFEPPPRPPAVASRRYRSPPWTGAPEGTLPGVVALERVLARTERIAVCVSRVAAFPTGFELDLVTMCGDEEQELDPFMFHGHRGLGHDDIPPELLRFGVQFADGSKATNTGGFHLGSRSPQAPVMQARGGGGGGARWGQTYWVWPLPAPGTLTLVCEWPSMEIPLTRTEVDAQLILDAATRAQVVFSDDHLPEPPDGDDGPCGPIVR